MRNKKFLRHELITYLKAHQYTLTYRQGKYEAFYFGPTRRYIFVPFNALVFTEANILEIFEKDAEFISQIEFARFELFIHQLRSSQSKS
ncbi:MAG: hypothetical protein ACPGSD_17435 [Flavobacteriales bacterium]